MKTFAAIATFLALLLVAGACLAAAPPPWQAVWESESAAAELSLVGEAQTMALMDGKTLSATAAVSAAGGKVRFDYKHGEHQWSLIDDGKNLVRLDARDKAAFMLKRPALAVDRVLAEKNYAASEAGTADIAGRPTRIIQIAPKSGGATVYRLWLDRQNGFALKQERYNIEGQLASSTEYTKVGFSVSIAPSVFEVPAGWRVERPRDVEERMSPSQLSDRLGFAVKTPRSIPKGYVLLGGYAQQWGRHERVMAELRYTDGLRVLSVYQRVRGQDEGAGEHGRHRRGEEGGGRGRGGGGGRGRGRGGERGRGGGPGFGPPGGDEMTLVNRGAEKALRFFGPRAVVVVVGDLEPDELMQIARSVE